MADFPNPDNAQKLAFCPDPSEDGGAPRQRRILSSSKYMQLCNDIMALAAATYVPVFNDSGSSIPAGPVAVSGFNYGSGYLINGAVPAGPTLPSTTTTDIGVDTGSFAIHIGNPIAIDGCYINGTSGPLQIFTAQNDLTGAGTLTVSPFLPMAILDNAVITIGQGFKIAPTAGGEAEWLIRSAIADGHWGIGYKVGSFASALDTSGGSVGDPVYVSSSGTLTLTAPDRTLYVVQVVGRVETVANPGRVAGLICAPQSYPGANIGADFGAQIVKIKNGDNADALEVYNGSGPIVATLAVDNSGNGIISACDNTGAIKAQILGDGGAFNTASGGEYQVDGYKIISDRQGGWTIAGSYTKTYSDLDPSGASAADCAARINALIDALSSQHGLIGA